MNIAINQSPAHENTLIWAIVCSMLLHGLLAWVIPNLKFDEVKTPDILKVELVKKPEPPPEVLPEPIPPPPEVVKPAPKPLPKPIVKPLPTPVEKIEPTERPAPPPPEVIAVAPKEAAPTPTHVAPIPVPVKQEPPPPVAPSQADIDGYSSSLWGAISKHKKYPKIAAMRGWEGEVIVELQLDGNGKLKSKKITQSSGHEVLDKQALEMVEKALPFPIPPDALRNSSFTITVPVPFKLENA